MDADRLDEIAALLRRLDIDVAALVAGPGAALGVISLEHLAAYEGRENECLAQIWRRARRPQASPGGAG